MTIKIRNELLPLNILVIVLIATALLSSSDVPRIILGLPFVIFFPGYTLIAALFTKKDDIDGIERLALSFGLSIAVVPLIGLTLNYLWEIRLEPVLYCVASFVFVTSIVAWFRRRRLPEQERFGIEFRIAVPGWNEGASAWQKTLAIILVLSILGAVGTFGYTLANPRVGERYTEFYILGLGGNATGYPEELVVGEEGRVIVGVVNHEHEIVTYQVELLIDGVENGEVGPVTLEHTDKWEEEVGFVPGKAGGNQTVQFLLYREGQEDAYRRLQLWIDVMEKRAAP